MISKAETKRISRDLKPVVQVKLSLMERSILRLLMTESGDKVLDASVGNGLLLDALHRRVDCEICGLSDEMESVREARCRLQGADIVYGTREDIPWLANSFDTVYWQSNGSAPSTLALQEAHRVLKPGGQLLIGMRRLPGLLQKLVCALQGNEATDIPKRDNTESLMHKQGYLQVTCQYASPSKVILIGWKPIELD